MRRESMAHAPQGHFLARSVVSVPPLPFWIWTDQIPCAVPERFRGNKGEPVDLEPTERLFTPKKQARTSHDSSARNSAHDANNISPEEPEILDLEGR
jgi:hypothetical protein